MFELYNVAIIPLIIGIVEVCKQAGVSAKYSPLLAVAIGILFGMFFISTQVKEGIIIGLMLGLSASGLYSGTKNTLERKGE